MILSDTIVQLINDQIAREQYASLCYKAAANWADLAGFDGAARFLHKASAEEIQHRDRFMAYLTDLDATPIVPVAVQAPAWSYSFPGLFTAALELERDVTRTISALYLEANKSGDFLTAQFLLWFIAEQQSSLAELLVITRWFVAFPGGLAMIDDKIGELAG